MNLHWNKYERDLKNEYKISDYNDNNDRPMPEQLGVATGIRARGRVTMPGGERAASSTDNVPYSCNECGEEFEIFRDLAKHKRAAQCKGEVVDEVDVRTTRENPAKISDNRADDSARNSLQCPQCNKIFKKQWTLDRHMQRHTIEAEKGAKVHQSNEAMLGNSDREEIDENYDQPRHPPKSIMLMKLCLMIERHMLKVISPTNAKP
ncbi:hypothetical protein PRIPAC_81005 [Pristionchus pacificus]|uniref:Zinc finger protein n=1 Tax=Pristionchus pacificus TaxID=54126 RepID=A0A2A6BVW8_PRIPA|nr:hypothetical protein PRIPAC_81005 [Pristionchus pacificus]|eukprot:PDM70018.1 zinc finger protein [Pristionchus pacificus]